METVKSKAEEMTVKQGITELRFTNERGETLMHHDWTT